MGACCSLCLAERHQLLEQEETVTASLVPHNFYYQLFLWSSHFPFTMPSVKLLERVDTLSHKSIHFIYDLICHFVWPTIKYQRIRNKRSRWSHVWAYHVWLKLRCAFASYMGKTIPYSSAYNRYTTTNSFMNNLI